MWAMGVLDGVKATETGPAALASYILIKLALITAFLIVGLRIAGGAESGLLKLSGRQVKWLIGLIGFMIVALALRFVLTKAMGSVLKPLGADPVTILLAGLACYLLIVFYVQMRLMPALIGVLLGDAAANLRWSWSAMKGHTIGAIATVVIVCAPFFALHLGNNIAWLPKNDIGRAAMLLFDGLVMAAFIQTSTAAYVLIYRKARDRGEHPQGRMALA